SPRLVRVRTCGSAITTSPTSTSITACTNPFIFPILPAMGRKSKRVRTGWSSIREGNVAADNALQSAMLGAEEQRAFFIQSFGAARNGPFTDGNLHTLAESDALFL